MQTGMNIGTVVDKDSLAAIASAVTGIMNQPGDQETIRYAIDALGRLARVENVTIQHCHIHGDNTIRIDAATHKITEEGE